VSKSTGSAGAGREPYLVTGANGLLTSAIVGALARQGTPLLLHVHRRTHRLPSVNAARDPFRADLARPGERRRLAGWAGRRAPLAGLILGASRFVKTPAASVTAETIGQVLALELEAHLDLALGLAPRVRDGGVILFFSDTGLRVGWPSYPVYLAAKGGLEAATRSLARALGPRLTVCCVAPGSVEGAPGMDAVMVKERTALGRPAAPPRWPRRCSEFSACRPRSSRGR